MYAPLLLVSSAGNGRIIPVVVVKVDVGSVATRAPAFFLNRAAVTLLTLFHYVIAAGCDGWFVERIVGGVGVAISPS